MRLRLVIIGLAAVAVSSVSRAAETPPLVAAMDAYFANPRAPGTFRALSGQGDPLFADYGNLYGQGAWADDQFRADLEPEIVGNCRTDYAFRIYRQRLKQLGREHPYFRQWLAAQKAVFENCRGWGERRPFTDLPPPLRLQDPALRRLEEEDRAYQHASALFYAGQMSKARSLFASIGRGSPHVGAARLMVIAIDAGSQPDGYSSSARVSALPKAEALLHDPSQKGVQSYAHELVGWIGATADTPVTRQAQVRVTVEALELPIAVLKSDPEALARYRRAAEDLPALHQDFDDPDWWLRAGPPSGYYGSAAMMKAAASHHVVAWALIPNPPEVQSPYLRSANTVPLRTEEGDAFLKRMVESGADGVAWKLLSRQLSGYYEPEIWGEIDAALARLKASPNEQDAALVPLLLQHQVNTALGTSRWDYDPVRVHRAIEALAAYPYKASDHFAVIINDALRRLMRDGRMGQARELRDRAEPAERSWQVSGTLMLLLAENDDQIAVAINKYGLQSSSLLNRLPASKLAELAANANLQNDERARLARAAWTRLYALNRPIPASIDRLMRTLNPKVTANWESKPGAQRGDKALLLDVLRSPAMNILATSRADSSRGDQAEDTAIDIYLHSTNNWWCALDSGNAASAADSEVQDAFGSEAQFSQLEPTLHASAVWMAFDPGEAAALGRLDSAPKQLSEAAIAWVEHPGLFGRRKGQDEALALAVRTTRYGCQMQGSHGPYSKRAFELLHGRFPNTDAAKRTKYWFDCKHFTYGCSDSQKDDQNYYPMEEEQQTESIREGRSTEADGSSGRARTAD